MIGALLLRLTWKRTVEKELADRDVAHMVDGWAEDGVLEFGGTHGMAGRFEGKAALRSWYTRWFDRMERLDFTVTRVGIVRPWALGLTNTVVYEARVAETAHDGTAVVAEVAVVADVRRGKLVRERVYLFDETPELRMWGPKPSAPGEDANRTGPEAVTPGTPPERYAV